MQKLALVATKDLEFHLLVNAMILTSMTMKFAQHAYSLVKTAPVQLIVPVAS